MNDARAHQFMGRGYEEFALSPDFCEQFQREHGTPPRGFIGSAEAQEFINALPTDDPLRMLKESVDYEIKMRMVAQWRAAQES